MKGIVSSQSGSCSGEVKMWPSSNIPDGFFPCDGRELSRTSYKCLFNAIGTIWGVGNGSTTFNIPNINGKVVVGYDSSQTEFNVIGKTGGEKAHILSTSELPAHNHANGSYNRLLKVDGTNTTGMTDNSSGEPRVNDSAGLVTVGSGLAHNNLQPYAVLNYIIKY